MYQYTEFSNEYAHQTAPNSLLIAAVITYALFCSQQLRILDFAVAALVRNTGENAQRLFFDCIFVFYLTSLLYIDCIKLGWFRNIITVTWIAFCCMINPIVYSTMPSGVLDYLIALAVMCAVYMYTRAHCTIDVWRLCFKASWFFLVDWLQLIQVPLGTSNIHVSSAVVLVISSIMVICNIAWVTWLGKTKQKKLELPIEVEEKQEKTLGKTDESRDTLSQRRNIDKQQESSTQRQTEQTQPQSVHWINPYLLNPQFPIPFHTMIPVFPPIQYTSKETKEE